MRVWIAQINTKVGDIEYNKEKIISSIRELWPHSDIVVFPENTTTWYACNDLYESQYFLAQQKSAIEEAKKVAAGISKDLTILLGNVDYNSKIMPSGQLQKFNTASIIRAYEETKYAKRLLPNYDVFFEKRYFTPWDKSVYFDVKGQRSSITICEDIWPEGYDVDPVGELIWQWVETIYNISSSPFTLWKLKKRYDLISWHVARTWAWFVYVNQVGAQDELVFDGGSMVMDNNWKLVHLGKLFQEELTIVDTNKSNQDRLAELLELNWDKYRMVFETLKLGLKDYLAKTWIKSVVIWLSGWIDSAVSAYILSQVLPKENIHTIYMPTKHSKSLEDAQAVAKTLGLNLKVGWIDPMVTTFMEYAQNTIWELPAWISYENIQARIRWNILMMYANMTGSMVINNSNKTELALGYGTMYGDLIGWLWLIWDLNKKEVFEFAKWINKYEWQEVMPNSIIDRPPSAELSDNQVDPFDYAKVSEPVDELLFGWNPYEIAAKYWVDVNEVLRLKKLVRVNEFKRRQAPLVIKLKNRSVGIGRLYPVV